ncbi:Lipoprotein-releasing system ATP-binding protein LolD [Rhodovastum atsumiense]|uniref:ABC transporter ATP-binding protein n=1 Tax=Rhodovastum atsumiense TaxID=504468 RepID=A0A5M6J182_9PROT|nr:ABC transporter ATP-binding protein [Rhodovastum atsumiense]KAA5613415.1 ABC transporter ATP-binding protein [Rhodovastum atsumiense]CAH2603140.1 Lipoprotein-releasing system ATP-binding protein LolD [Rhodovastum atsumiense]
MTPPPPAVCCRALTRSYHAAAGVVPALRGVDLEVAPGEVMFLVGPSGCGKTTLISIVAGVMTPDGGSCAVLGRDLATLGGGAGAAFRRRHVGFVFQAFNLVPTLTAAENVGVPLLLNGAGQAAAIRGATEALAAVGLADRAGQLPRELSGGQQQRVAIARALVHRPRLLVCDEPTSALDHRTGQEIMELLRGLAGRHGSTLLVVTHDHRIFGFADRIAEMDDGRIVTVRTGAA